jgi:hypothetical protein
MALGDGHAARRGSIDHSLGIITGRRGGEESGHTAEEARSGYPDLGG